MCLGAFVYFHDGFFVVIFRFMEGILVFLNWKIIIFIRKSC